MGGQKTRDFLISLIVILTVATVLHAALRRRALTGTKHSSASTSRGTISRRNVFNAGVLMAAGRLSQARRGRCEEATGANDIRISTTREGLEGAKPAKRGDWVLVNYVGKLKSGEVFDSTRGGMNFVNGGKAEYQPRLFQLNPYNPQPGVTDGLFAAIEGMRVGEVREASIPSTKGFGSQRVVGAFAEVPAGSDLEYEIQLLRCGDDLQRMLSGVVRCGQGGQAAQNSGCRDIQPMVTN
ncbi:hypothetical protein AAMO2058_000657700 [Amorphochlora amoebiformis]